jgi:hypothetical protein
MDRIGALAVRGTSTAVVMNIDQPRGQDVSTAVKNICVFAGELTPAATRSRGEYAAIFEGDEGASAIETRADQPDGTYDRDGRTAHWASAPVRRVGHGPGQYADGRIRNQQREVARCQEQS